jgi:hypothetical protein
MSAESAKSSMGLGGLVLELQGYKCQGSFLLDSN